MGVNQIAARNPAPSRVGWCGVFRVADMWRSSAQAGCVGFALGRLGRRLGRRLVVVSASIALVEVALNEVENVI
jgi:hypothetical protein